MPQTKLDLAGQKFGRLTAIAPGPNAISSQRKCTTWVCRCSCGAESVVMTTRLMAGKTKSCGCAPRAVRISAERPEVMYV